MQDRIEYVKRVATIHDEAVRRLVGNKDVSLDELASFFEDIGRLYLNIAEDIRDKTMPESAQQSPPAVQQSIFPLSPKEYPVEDLAG